MTFKVSTQGCIHVDSVSVQHEGNYLVAHISFSQKYVVARAVSDDGTIELEATERTLNLEGEGRESTIVSLDLGDDWHVEASGGRYGARVLAVRRSAKDAEVVYTAPSS